jgi:toxin ParE1/3/4
MRLVWSPRAQADLRRAYAFIATESVSAAEELVRRILQSADQLLRFPSSGRPGRVAGTRELVLPQFPFIIPYRVRDDVIEIIAVMHAAREWPEEFDEL